VVSKPFFFGKFTNLCCEMDTDCPQRVHCCLPSCWSAGSGFLKKSSVTFALKLYVQCVIGLIRNFFEEVLGLVARYSRTFLVRNSELF
jgi:hypothetical protein